jgi:2-succinyl-6-hydroxy-2,4-cyclohexadiene-1-carboxylate synthase
VTVRLIALHGFLGRAADWNVLAAHLPGVEIEALDLWKVLGDAGASDWASASAALDRALADAGLGGEVPRAGNDSPRPVFVIGYSFGARLALGSRLLSSPPGAARGCCLVSGNPGFADTDAVGRAARRASDEAWARRILEEPEEALWQAWDSQAVFAGSAEPAGRRHLPAPRELLARALAACSLAVQPDLRSRLRTWPTPLLWVTGARDSKFTAIAREMEQAGVPARFVTCADAGHRVPWDNPPAFAALLGEWIARHV